MDLTYFLLEKVYFYKENTLSIYLVLPVLARKRSIYFRYRKHFWAFFLDPLLISGQPLPNWFWIHPWLRNNRL